MKLSYDFLGEIEYLYFPLYYDTYLADKMNGMTPGKLHLGTQHLF